MASAKRSLLPLLGGVISDIAGVLRLGNVLRTKSGVPVGTARRALGDMSDVADETRTALLESLVESLFTHEYLLARHLTPDEIARHNSHVSAALISLARQLEPVARFANQMPGSPPGMLRFLLLMSGIQRDAALRVAAYLSLYDRRHPAFTRIEEWLSEDGLSVWYRDCVRRAGMNRVKFDRLAKATGVERNTIKKIARGVRVPQNATLEPLAEALCEIGLIDPVRGGPLSLSEITFELRVACATADVRDWLHRGGRESIESFLLELAFFRARFRTIDRSQAEEFLRKGTASDAWPELEADLRVTATRHIQAAVVDAEREAERSFQRDPDRALHELSEQFREQVAVIRKRPLDGEFAHVQERFARVFEELAAVLEGNALSGSRVDPRALEADTLVLQAITGSRDPSVRERLLRGAVEVSPTSSFARTALASLLRECGQTDEALAHLRVALELDCQNWTVRTDLALVLGQTTRYEEALAILDEGVGDAPLLANVTRAICLVQLGRHAEAETVLAPVAKVHPRHPLVLRTLADCREAKGDGPGAAKLRRQVRFYEGS